MAKKLGMSLSSRELRASLTSMAGYVGVWVLLGLPYLWMFLLAAAMESITVWPVVPLGIYGVAIVWSFSRLRQKALRRCHPVPALFGNGTDHAKAAGVWGMRLAFYCATVCFFAMSAPMLSGQGLVGMMIAIHVLLTERRTLRSTPRQVAIPLVLLCVASMIA